MRFNLECEREIDGRWLAEILELPGVLAYDDSANAAMAKAEMLHKSRFSSPRISY